MFKLLKHRHKWITTHVNQWQIPTIQKCKCGIIRKAETKLANEPLSYCWEYSDETISEKKPLGEL